MCAYIQSYRPPSGALSVLAKSAKHTAAMLSVTIAGDSRRRASSGESAKSGRIMKSGFNGAWVNGAGSPPVHPEAAPASP